MLNNINLFLSMLILDDNSTLLMQNVNPHIFYKLLQNAFYFCKAEN
jgi:hypothetical protein